MTRGRAKLEAERVRTPEISVEMGAEKASMASSEVTRASAHSTPVEPTAPDSLAVPQRARGMPSPTEKAVDEQIRTPNGYERAYCFLSR